MVIREPVPDALVDSRGQVRFGVFDGPLRNINLDEVKLKKGRLPLPMAAARFRLKEWQHFCLDLPGVFASFAIVDSRYLKVSWCHVVDRETGRHFEHVRQSPILDTRIARTLFADRCHVTARGYRLEVDNRLEVHEHRLGIAIDEKGDLPAVKAELVCLHDLARIEPLVVSLPVGPNRAAYSHKVAIPMEGTLSVGGQTYRAEAGDSHAILDIHKAHYPRHTWWFWATGAGRDADGRLIGLNLTHNVATDEERYNENGVWVDGKLHHLGPARFEMDRDDLMQPWRMRTTDGAADLEFTPVGERADTIDVGAVKSVFHQPYGTFTGTVETPGGEVEFQQIYGVCEDHDARW